MKHLIFACLKYTNADVYVIWTVFARQELQTNALVLANKTNIFALSSHTFALLSNNKTIALNSANALIMLWPQLIKPIQLSRLMYPKLWSRLIRPMPGTKTEALASVCKTNDLAPGNKTNALASAIMTMLFPHLKELLKPMFWHRAIRLI